MPLEFAMQVTIEATVGDPVEVDLTHERALRPLIQFMPPGLAWDLEPGSRLHELLRRFARVVGRFDIWLRAVVRNMSPWTAEAELPRWERLVGAKPSPSAPLAERQQQAGARLRARGGQSKTYWRELLVGLGYQGVEVEVLGDPFRCGDRVGKRVQGPSWMFVLVIRAVSQPSLDPVAEELIRNGVRGSVVVQFEWK